METGPTISEATTEVTNNHRRTARGWLLGLGLTVYYLLLGLAVTWPLARHLGTHVLGGIGDNLQYVWYFGWFPEAILHLHIWPFFEPFFNWPYGSSLAYDDFVPAQVALAFPFAAAWGDVVGYNVAVLITFMTSGLGVHLWVRQLSRDVTSRRCVEAAALLAGSLYAACTFRIVRADGHLHIVGTNWLPFYFMSLCAFLDMRGDASRRDLLRRSFALAGWLLLIGLTSVYYLVMTTVVTVLTVIAVLVREVIVASRAHELNAYWSSGFVRFVKRYATLGVLCGIAALLAAWPYIALRLRGDFPPRDFSQSVQWAAAPFRFFMPSVHHPIFGPLVQRLPFDHEYSEFRVYLGLVPVGLALAGWWFARRRDGNAAVPYSRLFWWFVLAVILALGPRLKLTDTREAFIPLPAALQHYWGWPQIRIPLPGTLLTRFFPFYSTVRCNARWGAYSSLFICALAGAYAGRVVLPRFRPALVCPVALLLIIVGVIDQHPGPRLLSKIEPREVDKFIASRPEPGAVAQFPFKTCTDQIAVYGTLFHHRPFLGGTYITFFPKEFRERSAYMWKFPDEQSLAELRRSDVRFIILKMDEYVNLADIEQRITASGMQDIYHDEKYRLYLLAAP